MKFGIGPDWRDWVTRVILKNKLDDVRSLKSPVRLFSPNLNEYNRSMLGSDYWQPGSRNFNCSYQLGKQYDMVDTFLEYNKIRDDAGIETEIAVALSKKDFNSEILKNFSENLGKIRKGTPVLKEQDRTTYLMPDAVGQDWHSVLTSIEYNLR